MLEYVGLGGGYSGSIGVGSLVVKHVIPISYISSLGSLSSKV
jgi:hypothetical protein